MLTRMACLNRYFQHNISADFRINIDTMVNWYIGKI